MEDSEASNEKKTGAAAMAAPWVMVLAVCIWGFGYIVTKITLEDEISPLLLTASSYVYGALGGIPILIWKRKMLSGREVFREGAVLGAVLFLSRFFMRLILKERMKARSVAAAVITLDGIGLVAVNENVTGVNTGDLLSSHLGRSMWNKTMWL